jgi:phage N-6-adenine-methyltransferase
VTAELIERAEVPSLTTREDATASLKHIAVAEAAEDYWAKAKDAGQLFQAIKTKLEHQAAYAVWRQDLARRGGDGSNQYKRANAAEQRELLPASDPGQDMVDRWRKRLCVKQAQRWLADQLKIQQALEDAHHRCVRICEQEKDGTIRGTEGTGEFERYTPAEYIAAVRQVLGEIDLDPATSVLAQQTVGANEYFTEEDNGLEHEWHGRVFLNPPYHRDLAPRFIDKLLEEYDAGRTTTAILLTNNSTDTQWFRLAAMVCDSLCFTAGRIHFIVPNRDPVLPTQGQAFFYFGERPDRFVEIFHEIGFCMRPDNG